MDKSTLPSRHVTEGVENTFHRVFYYAMGLGPEEIHQPHVGVVAAWDETVPAGPRMRTLVEDAKAGVWAARGTPREFTTIAGLDHDGMPVGSGGGSLLSRELIADSVELTVRGHSYDALVGCAASDNAIAGLAMAALRLDIASVILWCPPDDTGGAVPGRAMAAAIEALGLGFAGSTLLVAEDAQHRAAHAAGETVMRRLEAAERPRALVTPERLCAAATTADGSTSVLLHLLALANEAGVDVTVDDLAKAASTGSRRATVLRGNLAPEGSLAWSALSSDHAIEGPVRVFEDETSACAALAAIPSDAVVVVRFQGPRGGPGVRELGRLGGALASLAAPPLAIVSDGRIVADGSLTVSGVTPEAASGGALARVRDGDRLRIDLGTGLIELAVAEPELARREPREQGVRDASSAATWKYVRLAGPAIDGALTHPGAAAEAHCYATL